MWIGWFFLLVIVALVVVLIRGVVHLASWAFEEYFESRWLRRRGEEPGSPSSPARPKEPPPKRRPLPEHHADPKSKTVSDAVLTRHEHKTSRFGKALKSLLGAATGKGYDYWVGAALAEDDWNVKVEYLGKALRLNPAYLPAWGLKGNALFHLQRYAEAIECFDRHLQAHATAPFLYKKGLCLYHLKRPGEAMACIEQAIQACTERDRELLEEASRMRQTLAADIQHGSSA
jgi:tetratricopeptide (TPR) repeat protein